jgi:hypothetical protein
MPPDVLRFRQIHLDFHTSPDISGLGTKFNRKKWQETLKRATVNSVILLTVLRTLETATIR